MVEKKDIDRGKRSIVLLAAILLVGMAVRIVYLVQLGRSDLGGVISLDARFYRDLAMEIASGGGLPAGAITFNPLYPAFLALVFRIFGDGLAAPRILQFVLGLATLSLIFIAGRRLVEPAGKGRPSGKAVGTLAAAIALLYPHLVLYEGSLVATSLVTFILTAAFTLSLALDQDLVGVRRIMFAGRGVPRWLSSLVLGGLLGAGALGRPNLFFILVPAVALWLFFRHSRRAGGVRLAAACLIGTFILLVPPILYNVSQTGRFVPVTAHGGINFYIGNGPKARSIYRPPEGMRRDMRGLIEDTKLGAEREVGRSLTNAEASDYWFGAALDRIFTDPAGWLRLVGMKLLVFWNGIEVPDIIDLSFYRDSCPVLKLLFIPFAVISPLSLLGLIILLKGRRNRGIVLLFVLAALVSVLLFYVNSRYRMPSIPILVLASAVSVSWVIEAIAGRRWTQVIAVASLFTALLLLVSTREIIVINRSAMYNFLGNHYMEITEEVKAEAAFAEAYRLDPESIEAQINYGRVLRKRGREEKAERFYAEAYGSRPDFPRLAIEYGSLLERMGRRKEAKKLYLYALSLERAHDRVLACKLLSRAAFSEGKRDEAISWIKKALKIVPGDRNLIEMLHRLEGVQ